MRHSTTPRSGFVTFVSDSMTLHLFGAPRSPCGNDEGPFSITLEGTTCVDCLRASALAGVAQIHGLEAALTALRAERDKWQSLLPAGLVEQNKHLERQLRIEIDNAQRAEAELSEARARLAVPQAQNGGVMNTFLQDWHDAVNAATEWTPDSPSGRWMARVSAAGMALARDYEKLAERANREARLAVALRQKLHEVAGPEVASSVNVE